MRRSQAAEPGAEASGWGTTAVRWPREPQRRPAERDGGQNPQHPRRTVPPSDNEGPLWLSSRGRMGSASSEALPLAAGWEASRLTGSPSPDGMEHGREAGCPAQAPVTAQRADVLSTRPLAALSLGLVPTNGMEVPISSLHPPREAGVTGPELA